MARIDDYIAAKKIAVAALSKEPLLTILDRSGFSLLEENRFEIPFLNRMYKVDYPQFAFSDSDDAEKEVPIQEEVLLLHYLQGGGKKIQPSSTPIAYREVEGASFYFSSFVKRAIDPLKKVFGQDKEGFRKVARELQGTAIDAGDAGFTFQLLPKISLELVLWEGDEEFPAEANILFEDNISDYLSPEDVAWLSGMLVYRLISFFYQK